MNVVVTGGTSGIGAAVVRELSQNGQRVSFIGRNRERGQAIAAETGGHFIQADLSLLRETHQVAAQFQAPIDSLILCAGGIGSKATPLVTSEGFETVFATNYLSKFSLSQQLLPQLTTNASIVMVSGNSRYNHASTAWQSPEKGLRAALKASLALDLYAQQLAKNQPTLRIHTCYPGMVRTNLFKQQALPVRLLIDLFGQASAQASSYLTRLIYERHEGVHWHKTSPMQLHLPPTAADVALELWNYSHSLLAKYS
ncbi:SDR family NAD(P)-dependent oxidoreductase [Herpetosiphon giganteus]|uniref:SDR family NAD(P)-dependent oxidoreductase n=1 Tax=Herpetosiphon giganteus TaxID=2029754 RepID=UPI001958F2B8|nr:SDR family NAD(P)-dependent oxidoreductase [Herpetosiphon giganteus]MBM7844548.1 NAD(P)-dependent dehydrogenase (short-subunit alcohol dehydrogenase family) [Herpetosiphon giganteus]